MSDNQEIIKVSFDFDDTLIHDEVQDYAARLTDDPDIEVWIVTARISPENVPAGIKAIYIKKNKDLFDVAERLGIPEERIVFMGFTDKYEFFKDKGFLWHIDDDEMELRLIDRYTETFGVTYVVNNNWYDKCEFLLS